MAAILFRPQCVKSDWYCINGERKCIFLYVFNVRYMMLRKLKRTTEHKLTSFLRVLTLSQLVHWTGLQVVRHGHCIPNHRGQQTPSTPPCDASCMTPGDHSITVTSYWVQWHLKSTVYRLFTQPFVQVQITETIKAPRHWSLWGEFTRDR